MRKTHYVRELTDSPLLLFTFKQYYYEEEKKRRKKMLEVSMDSNGMLHFI